ncbi:pyruvate dehydrogenase E2 component (dihydrolipoamide acetyltransferase) [Chelatococcus caeni]|uniref:Dihydrolipoamide acetyltransferase component of pyruvate dehydrogenase complex n=1 Tax=Chelatococcus caeni TaxID=1348468 RepID=A0A840C7J6_9HYPH|nr:dihydrolipoamide acetyltransferase family protein [Chelatococcus caeni]MBB4019379.1 pyruvate dehydrogenase E2 component (dihydrolipoamide acetyltransferase) [Chelatococcus caeni]
MPVEVILPKVDMDMETGSIEAWKVAEGDAVKQGDILFEIGTNKAVMEVEAPASGIIRNLVPASGEPIAVGTPVAWIFQEGEEAGEAAEPTAGAPGTSLAVGRVAPQEGPLPSSVTTPTPSPSPQGGGESGAPMNGRHAAPTADGIRATPLARRTARLNGIAIDAVTGSGPRGRITEKDVLAHLAQAESAAPAPVAARAPAETPAEGELVPFGPVRRIIASRLAESMRVAPHFYMTAQMDMSALQALLKRVGPRIEKAVGVKPSLTVLLARVVGGILPRHPMLNASVEGDAARLHAAVNIGIAMERDGDLVVPVLRGAEGKTLAELTRDFGRLREAVASRSIQPADMRGGTFTLSNLGMFGVDSFTAIINQPESAILAIGRTVEMPVGRNGEIVLRPMATFSLSSDHRIVDGVAAARFMADLREAIECPEVLI